MTNEEIKNISELVDSMLDESIIINARTKLHERLEELCELAIKALEQEPILDKIRAEIESLEYLNIEDGSDGYDKYIEQYEVLKIIDKYKAESEEKK